SGASSVELVLSPNKTVLNVNFSPAFFFSAFNFSCNVCFMKLLSAAAVIDDELSIATITKGFWVSFFICFNKMLSNKNAIKVTLTKRKTNKARRIEMGASLFFLFLKYNQKEIVAPSKILN